VSPSGGQKIFVDACHTNTKKNAKSKQRERKKNTELVGSLCGMSKIPLRYATDPPTETSHWIVPRLLASAYPGKVDLREHKERVATLVAAGFTHWVCLQTADELKRFTPYRELVRKLSPTPPTFIGVPIPDCGVTDDGALIALVERLSSILAADDRNRILLHCWGGWTRTGTVASLWMSREFGIGATEAVRLYTAMARAQRTNLGTGACKGPTDTQKKQILAICARNAHLENKRALHIDVKPAPAPSSPAERAGVETKVPTTLASPLASHAEPNVPRASVSALASSTEQTAERSEDTERHATIVTEMSRVAPEMWSKEGKTGEAIPITAPRPTGFMRTRAMEGEITGVEERKAPQRSKRTRPVETTSAPALPPPAAAKRGKIAPQIGARDVSVSGGGGGGGGGGGSSSDMPSQTRQCKATSAHGGSERKKRKCRTT
jgi:protein-tyrosine phosphatase